MKTSRKTGTREQAAHALLATLLCLKQCRSAHINECGVWDYQAQPFRNTLKQDRRIGAQKLQHGDQRAQTLHL